jgi:hypothetical protein
MSLAFESSGHNESLSAPYIEGNINVPQQVGFVDDGGLDVINPPIEVAIAAPVELCAATDSPDLIHRARQLTTRRYLRRNFITEDEVVDGIIENDPPHEHSTYYVLRNESANQEPEVVATLRKIHWSSMRGEASFPVWEHKDELDPEAVEQIEEIGLDRCVEISALVKDPKLDADGMAAFKLYRSVFQDSLKARADGDREDVFLMAANPMLFQVFKSSFNGYVKRIGPDLDYPGQEAVPAMMRPRDGMIDALRRMAAEDINNESLKFSVAFLLEGLDESDVDPVVAQAMVVARSVGAIPPIAIAEADIAAAEEDNFYLTEEFKEQAASRIKEHIERRKPEYVAGAGLIGYTALRTLGVAHEVSPDTSVSWQTFLGIEIATTPTYVAAMGDMARSIVSPDNYSTKHKIGAATVAATSFLAPYAYVLSEGESMPKSSLAGVAAVLGVSALSVVKRLWNARRDSRE